MLFIDASYVLCTNCATMRLTIRLRIRMVLATKHPMMHLKIRIHDKIHDKILDTLYLIRYMIRYINATDRNCSGHLSSWINLQVMSYHNCSMLDPK